MNMPPIDTVLWIVTLLAALGCGLLAGLFFIFSNTVMKALAHLPTSSGMAAMQSINVVILNPLFLGLFLGTAAACLLLAVLSIVSAPVSGSVYLLGGSGVYLGGGFLVTVFFNVPRNDALERLDAASPESAGAWSEYVRTWTRWNHVRTLACLVAAALLTVAFAQL